MEKPEKIYLNNPKSVPRPGSNANITGALRETLLSMLQVNHTKSQYRQKGDFLIDDRVTIEVSGKQGWCTDKIFRMPGWLDNIETGHGNRVPLWLFSLYTKIGRISCYPETTEWQMHHWTR